MSFFEVPPLPPEAERCEPEPQPWQGPPPRMLPGTLVETLVLAHTERVAVVVTGLAAYPTGFSFSLQTIPRQYDPHEWSDVDAFSMRPPRTAKRELPAELLRFGVEFADGGRATSLDLYAHSQHDPGAAPKPPVLWPCGGGGGGGRWSHDVWVWPLPPAGSLIFACEWPAVGIPFSRAVIDADRIHDAASRARLLWPDVGEPPAES